MLQLGVEEYLGHQILKLVKYATENSLFKPLCNLAFRHPEQETSCQNLRLLKVQTLISR